MSYLEDIKSLQETVTTNNKPLNAYASITCTELLHECRVCTARSSCIALKYLRIPLSVVEEALKSHPELLV